MAFMTVSFFSNTLDKSVNMSVIIPENVSAPLPVLYLLHGYSDDHTAWVRKTSVERYAEEAKMAVIMPDVDHSFYTDMTYGKRYFTFLTDELPKKVRYFFPISTEREATFVAGLSMGGYGAFKWALTKPEYFKKAAALSGVVDLVSYISDRKNSRGPLMKQIFGDCSIEHTEDDLFYLLEACDKKTGQVPSLYLACGQEDFLFKDNVTFATALEQTKLKSVITYDHGAHVWSYWDKHIQKVFKWMLEA